MFAYSGLNVAPFKKYEERAQSNMLMCSYSYTYSQKDPCTCFVALA